MKCTKITAEARNVTLLIYYLVALKCSPPPKGEKNHSYGHSAAISPPSMNQSQNSQEPMAHQAEVGKAQGVIPNGTEREQCGQHHNQLPLTALTCWIRYPGWPFSVRSSKTQTHTFQDCGQAL